MGCLFRKSETRLPSGACLFRIDVVVCPDPGRRGFSNRKNLTENEKAESPAHRASGAP